LFNTLVKVLLVFVGVVTLGVVVVLVIGFTGEVGFVVVGVVIGFTGATGVLVVGVVIASTGVVGVFGFDVGLTAGTGGFVVLVIGLTEEVFTALEAGLTVVAVFGATGLTTEVVGVLTGATGFVPPEVIGLPTGVVGRTGMAAGVLTPPTGRFVFGAKVPALSTPEGGRLND